MLITLGLSRFYLLIIRNHRKCIAGGQLEIDDFILIVEGNLEMSLRSLAIKNLHVIYL